MFEFILRNTNFFNNSNINHMGVGDYDHIFKVSYHLETFIKGTRGVRTARKYVTIDESAIKYIGRSVTYVKYMTGKSIKHGIKVFAICCALYVILLGIKVYIVQEDDSDNTDMGICGELIK